MSDQLKVDLTEFAMRQLLPTIWKEKSMAEARKREWRLCFICARPPIPGYELRRCGKCGDKFSGLAVRYCSRSCQKKHWPTHKRECGVVEFGLWIKVKGDPALLEIYRHQCKQIRRWNLAYNGLVAWACQEIVRSPIPFDNQRSYLAIEMKTDGDYGNGYPTSFQSMPFPNVAGGPDHADRVVDGVVKKAISTQITINGIFMPFRMHFVDAARSSLVPAGSRDKPSPQWPWLLATACLFGDTSSHIAWCKVSILQMVSRPTIAANPRRVAMFVPPQDLEQRWEIHHLKEWQKWMEEVMQDINTVGRAVKYSLPRQPRSQ